MVVRGVPRALFKDGTMGISWRSLLPWLLLALSVAYLALMGWRTTNERLYWEYAGRLTHRSFTPGFTEWDLHRDTAPEPKETPRRAGHVLPLYTGFATPYPPGAMFLFAAVRLPFDGLLAFSRAYAALVALCICLAAVLMMRLATRWSGDPDTATFVVLAFLIWLGLTGPFAVARFDSVVVLFVSLALFLREGGWRLMAGFCLGLGASMKLWPALLVPFVALPGPRGARSGLAAVREASSVGIGALIGFALPHGIALAMGTAPADLFAYLTVYGERPPQVESLLANLLAIGRVLGLTTATPGFDFASSSVTADHWRTIARVFTVAFGASYLGALFCALRAQGSRRAEIFAMGFVVIAVMLGSKVFSGEYLIWMLPFALLAVGARLWGIVAAYAAALLFLKFGYWNWEAVMALRPFGTLLVACKNAACLVMAALFAHEMIRAAPLPPSGIIGARD